MRPFTPGLLIFHEKHGNWHYDVPTENHYQAACLTVLTRRFEEGYWYHDPLEEESHEWDPEPPQMSLEEIEKLPEGEIRDTARRQHAKYAGWKKEREEGHQQYERIKKAIKTGDGQEARWLIEEFSHGEYEGYTFEGVERPEPLPRPTAPEHETRWVDPETGQRWIFEAEEGLGWIHGEYARIRYCVMAHKGEEVIRTAS